MNPPYPSREGERVSDEDRRYLRNMVRLERREDRRRWRYEFAARAMAGLVASGVYQNTPPAACATMAVELADALLDELEKPRRG
jgi:hypothetical protein